MGSDRPLGKDAVGKQVARDFGEKHGGIFFGRVVSVRGTCKLIYHVRYTDGDEEDFDEDEYSYAYDLAIKHGEEQRSQGKSVPDDETSSGESSSGDANDESSAAHTSFGAKTMWKNMKPGRQTFKPVITRAKMREEETKPRFHPPCLETKSIDPYAFAAAFLPDDLVQKVANHSEHYRNAKGVLFSCV